MVSKGILQEDDPVELLDGWIVPKMPRTPLHDSMITRLQRLLYDLLGPGWVVRSQCAVTVPESEPEPDITVAIGPDSRYDDHHPHPDEIALIVEVADSSLERDRDPKATLYARAGIPLYWIVNLPGRVVEVRDNPTGSGESATYALAAEYDMEEDLPLIVFGRQVGLLPVRDLFPH